MLDVSQKRYSFYVITFLSFNNNNKMMPECAIESLAECRAKGRKKSIEKARWALFCGRTTVKLQLLSHEGSEIVFPCHDGGLPAPGCVQYGAP